MRSSTVYLGPGVTWAFAHTEGASPAYIKELLRKAAVLAASHGTAPHVSGAELRAAVEELNAGGELAQRLSSFRPTDQLLARRHATHSPHRSVRTPS
jgi:hypothetical protein